MNWLKRLFSVEDVKPGVPYVTPIQVHVGVSPNLSLEQIIAKLRRREVQIPQFDPDGERTKQGARKVHATYGQEAAEKYVEGRAKIYTRMLYEKELLANELARRKSELGLN